MRRKRNNYAHTVKTAGATSYRHVAGTYRQGSEAAQRVSTNECKGEG